MKEQIEIRPYFDEMGRSAFLRWAADLGTEARFRVSAALEKIEAGNWAILKGVGGGVSEIRLDYGPGYRVYCARDGETLVLLLAGGTKRRQHEDIERARLLWREYKTRKSKL